MDRFTVKQKLRRKRSNCTTAWRRPGARSDTDYTGEPYQRGACETSAVVPIRARILAASRESAAMASLSSKFAHSISDR
jgi:hypothetical protein